ncbi:MAG TPA: alpha/beta fold hydrolase [Actinomycetota bacterium]|nr:alpha/beta fold hydrolase [Actinomycetota bacterium]
MQERWFDVTGADGVRLRAREVAGPTPDAPGLLLHHGLASSQRIWDLMLPRLARRFRTVTYDARGHGLSAKPTSGYGFDHVVADAVAVLRVAKLGRPVVVGHSWGAMVALELAVTRPRSASGITLIDGGVSPPGDRGSWEGFKTRLAPPMLDGMALEEFRAGMRRFSAVPVTPQIEALFLSLMRVDADARIHPRLSRANHFRILRAIWEQDPPALYERLRTATMAILARGDDATWNGAKREGVRAMRSAGVPVEVTWIRGVHDLPVQHPGRLATRIERFADAAVG